MLPNASAAFNSTVLESLFLVRRPPAGGQARLNPALLAKRQGPEQTHIPRPIIEDEPGCNG